MTLTLLKKNLLKRLNPEAGQAFILVLILILFGALVTVPLLNFVNTGLKMGTVYEKKTNELYAADSGINAGQWEIQNEMLASGLQTGSPSYAPYDFNSSWPLQPQTINAKTVNSTVNNVWMFNDLPGGLALATPNQDNAVRLINGFGNPVTAPKVAISSGITAPYVDSSHPGTIGIKIQYLPPASPEDLEIKTLGIWLPPGYSYVANSSNIGSSYNAAVTTSLYKGGSIVIWSFSGGYPFKGATGPPLVNPFPGVNPAGSPPLVSNVSFQFTAGSTSLSPPIAWIDTNLDLTQGGSPALTYTWDGNVLVYHILSVATTPSGTNTQVDTYLTKYQLHTVTASVNGDYCITGGSLMNASLDDIMNNRKSSVKSSSSNTIQTKQPGDTTSSKIPADANVLSAVLYWSGWLNQSRNLGIVTVPPFPDTADSFNNWNNGTAWVLNSGNFKGGGSASGKDLTLKNVLNLSSYGSAGTINVNLDQPLLATLSQTSVPPFPDAANNFNNWNNGSAWVLNSGNFKGGGSAGGKDLTLKNALNLTSYGSTGSINVYLDQPVLASLSQTSVAPLNPDAGNNLSNWTNGSAWSSTGTSYKGVGSVSGKDLTLKNGLNLSTYGSTGSINVSLDTPVLGTPAMTNVPPLNPDPANSFNNWNNGTAWSLHSGNFQGGGGASGKDLTLKNTLNLSNYGTTGSINVSLDPPTLSNPSPVSVSPLNPDTADNFNNWTAGSAWDTTTSPGQFSGWAYNKTSPGRDLTSTGLNLSTYGSTGTVNVTWSQSLASGNGWSTLSSTGLSSIGAGGCLVYGGGGYIYALRGGSQTTFYRYNISGNSWATMTAAPGAIGAGGSLVYDGSNYIYALRGGSQTTFYRYSISGNSWSTMTAAPSTIGAGGSLVYNGSTYIYAFRGGSQTTFYRYSISGNSWSTMAAAPGSIGDGGSLVYDGSTYIYAFRGGSQTTFYRYSISGNSWSTMTAAPASIGTGGTLDYFGSGNTIYALRGNNSNTLYSYSISGNSWSTLANAPGNVTTGGNFCFDSGGYAYAFQGGSTAFWRYTPATVYSSSDGLDFSYYNGTSWVGPSQIFRGGSPGAGAFTISSITLPANFQIRFSLVGCTSAGECLYLDNINVSVTPSYAGTDGLNVSYSLDGGTTWTSNVAFTGNLNGLTNSWTIPNGTLPANFLIKFSLVGFSGSAQYCYLDNINVSVTPSYAGTDGLNLSYSLDGGATWVPNSVFTGNLGGLTTSWTIPNGTLPANFLIKFSLVGFIGSWQYCTIDNIYVKVTPSYASTDGLNFSYSLDGGTTWVTNPVFTGNLNGLVTNWTIPNGPLPSNFLVKFSLVGMAGSTEYCTIDNINIQVTPSYAGTDGLDFSYSMNGGYSWTTQPVFRGTGVPTNSFPISNVSLPTNFLIKFSLVGLTGSGQYCTIDDITVTVNTGLLPSDSRMVFNINGNAQQITADPYDSQKVISKQVINSSGQQDGYYYACQQDVTDLVKQYSNGANWNADPKVNGNGAGTYTLSPVSGDRLGDIFEPDGVSYATSSYAGWSLVVVYSSPETKGNYLKLYDWNYWPDKFSVRSNLLDQNNNSIPNVFTIPITGFVVPQQESGEADAAKITVFVGEGDPQITGDYVALLDQSSPTTENKLWDGVILADGSNTPINLGGSGPNNVWNGQSAEFPSEIGIDIDTFHVLWNDPVNGVTLRPDDTFAQMEFYTFGDGYVLIYMIASFRSVPTTGGSMIYAIK